VDLEGEGDSLSSRHAIPSPRSEGGMQDIKTCERFTAAPITKQLQDATAAAVQVWAARPENGCVKTNKARLPACLVCPSSRDYDTSCKS